MAPNIKSNELYEAMRDYVRAAMSLLGNECPDVRPRILKGLEEWRRDADNLFRRHEREEPPWVECIRSHEDQIHALAEYGQLTAVVRSIPEISGQLETLVGTISQAQRIEIAHITDHLIWEVAKSSSGFFFDEFRFDQLFERFITDLGRMVFDYYSIGPLLGFNIEASPLSLESGVVLDRMTDAKLVVVCQSGSCRAGRDLCLSQI